MGEKHQQQYELSPFNCRYGDVESTTDPYRQSYQIRSERIILHQWTSSERPEPATKTSDHEQYSNTRCDIAESCFHANENQQEYLSTTS
mgnify:CR=1